MCKLPPAKPGENLFRDLPLKVPKVFKNAYPVTRPLKFLSMSSEASYCGCCGRPAHWSEWFAKDKLAREAWIAMVDRQLQSQRTKPTRKTLSN